MSKYSVAIVIASDKGYSLERKDLCVDTIKSILDDDFDVVSDVVLPDEQNMLTDEMIRLSDDLQVNLILTSGGTGFSKRDVTVEATEAVIHRQTPGISEIMRIHSLSITKNAMLSRATSGIRNNTLIINLPGSPKAVKEILEYILQPLKHGLDVIQGDVNECGR